MPRPQSLTLRLPVPHPKQNELIQSKAKRKVVRGGRRGGKTVALAILACEEFNRGKRILYAAPTTEQLDRFWTEITRALQIDIDNHTLYKNETEHVVERPRTEQRIRAKTAWNANTLRGDYADLLILDEWQLMNEDAWQRVGAPMLLDNDGDAIFVYTPPSIRTRGGSKAVDSMHAAKLFKAHEKDTDGRWATFHFSSHANPHISSDALGEITKDMTALAYQQEIEALDIESDPNALWDRERLEALRIRQCPDLVRIVVAIDPAVSSGSDSDDTGIIVAGIGNCLCKGIEELHGFVLADVSIHASPARWANAAITAYHSHHADRIIGETNNGGDMIEYTIRTIEADIPFTKVYASRGKEARAEPISALYEHGKIHHIGFFEDLEEQMCTWVPGKGNSPDRVDALVWAFTELMLEGKKSLEKTKAAKPSYARLEGLLR